MFIDVFFSLGSNIEPKIDNLKNVISCLESYFGAALLSSVYRTAPIGDTDQDCFYNMAVCCKIAETDPYAVLAIINRIEEELGRVRDPLRPKGPRAIDIDIILFGDISIDTQKLTIPHKMAFERNFVLVPLSEICSSDIKNKYNIPERIRLNAEQIVEKIGVI